MKTDSYLWMRIFSYFGNRSPLFWIFIGAIFIAGIGTADFLTGSELSFSLFYLVPIFAVTWFSGKRLGIIFSVASAMVWFMADSLAGHAYSQPVIRYWNALVRLSFFLVVTLLLPALKALEHEKTVARTDELTGIANRRYFLELAKRELDLSQRYHQPLTIAYMDLDNFKMVNDRWGHKAGDNVLHLVVTLIKHQMRETDIIARLGGDEFALLFPQTDQQAARSATTKIHSAVTRAMQENNWSITFSMGVLTCLGTQITMDEMIHRADQLMYAAKRNGKNEIVYDICMD
jgi:diguanylate cyclase (GGDEF)-like protein